MPSLLKVNGVWQRIVFFIRRLAVWRSVVQVFVRIAGVWRPIYGSYFWNSLPWGDCSVLCGGGTQTRTVNCMSSEGAIVEDSICLAVVGERPITSQPCNTAACSSCEYKYTSGTIQAGDNWALNSSGLAAPNASIYASVVPWIIWNGQTINSHSTLNPNGDSRLAVVGGGHVLDDSGTFVYYAGAFQGNTSDYNIFGGANRHINSVCRERVDSLATMIVDPNMSSTNYPNCVRVQYAAGVYNTTLTITYHRNAAVIYQQTHTVTGGWFPSLVPDWFLQTPINGLYYAAGRPITSWADFSTSTFYITWLFSIGYSNSIIFTP